MSTSPPIATNQPNWLSGFFGSKGETGNKVRGICNARNTRKVQRVQRGTNRPLGNSRKTSTSKAWASKLIQRFGTSHGEELLNGTFTNSMIRPNVISMSATKNAIRSSGLRQMMSVLTTKHMSIEINASTIVNAAYLVIDRPTLASITACE